MKHFVLYGHDLGIDFFTEAPACSQCLAVLDAEWVGPIAKRRVPDVSYSYDGALIVSERFAGDVRHFDGVRCVPLPGPAGASRLLVDELVVVDPFASQLERFDFCTRCNAWGGIRNSPAYVVAQLPRSGFSRTDVSIGFGLGPKRPYLRKPHVMVDAATAERLRRQRYSGLVLTPVELSTRAGQDDEPSEGVPHS